MRTFHVKTFGCRASQADGAALEGGLSERGLRAVGDSTVADFVVLNTCTVTSTADDELRQVVRRVHRANPESRIVVTGCYAQRAPQEIAALPGVWLVAGNSHKHQIADWVAEEASADVASYHGQVAVGDILEARDFLSAPVEEALGDRTRPNLKVQDGCSNRCSFCIIPAVRGRSRSAPGDRVVEQVRTLAGKYREVVLSGINLGRWGRDLEGRSRLADLVKRLLDEAPVERLRLSSVEPMDWSSDLIELVAGSPRIAKHVHAPLQSGSDAVLRRMRRKYRPRHYADRIETARRAMPTCGVGADVMTGFPGETVAEFEESLSFIESLPFTYLHVFTYSERPGTPAADLPQVPMEVRKHRTRVLRALAQRKSEEFRRSLAGTRLSAVTIEDGSVALSSNYVKLRLAWRREPNRLIDVLAGEIEADSLVEAGSFRVLPQVVNTPSHHVQLSQ